MPGRYRSAGSRGTHILPRLNIVTAIVILVSGCSPDALEPDRSATASVTTSSTTYYVAPSGDDGRSCLDAQNINTPLRTLNAVMSKGCLTAGSTLLIRGGIYEEALVNSIPSGTSWAEPVTLKAYPGEPVTLRPPSGSEVIFFGTVSGAGRQYVVIDSLILDGANVTNAVKIHYDGSNPALASHHIRFINCEIMNARGQGILVGSGAANYNEFINLKVHNNGGPVGSSNFNHGIYITTANNLVENSDFYSNAAYGVHIYADPGGTADSNVVRNNRVHDNNKGITIGGGTGNLIYNNLIYGNSVLGAQVAYQGVDSTKFYNNTVYSNGVGNGGDGLSIDPLSTNTTVRNNILYSNGNNYSNGNPGTIQDHNLIGVDPKFVNAAGYDFHLQSTSPAIDQGVTLTEVPNDVDGVSRPQGAAYDIGAYEHVSVSPSGPVASWSFDEGAGQTAADASGNGNTATLGSTTAAEPSDPLWVPGRISNALQYDGSSSRTTVAGSPIINNLAAFTYVAWVHPTATNVGRVFSKETSATFDEFYFIATTNLEAVLRNTANMEFISRAAPVPLNAWSHIAVTYNDAGDRKLHLFLNGSEVAYDPPPQVVTGTLRVTANTLIIGNRIGGDRAFQGRIDEGKVYDRALSAAEIQALFNAGNPGP